MKPAVEWLNEVGEAVTWSMFSGTLPPGNEVEALIKRIQRDVLTTAFDLVIEDGNPELAKARIMALRETLR
jgi:hypothetical protein